METTFEYRTFAIINRYWIITSPQKQYANFCLLFHFKAKFHQNKGLNKLTKILFSIIQGKVYMNYMILLSLGTYYRKIRYEKWSLPKICNQGFDIVLALSASHHKHLDISILIAEDWRVHTILQSFKKKWICRCFIEQRALSRSFSCSQF